MLRKLKVTTTLATLLALLFVGAMLIPASPVKAGYENCCSKKKAETDEKKKSCGKDKGSEEKKGCDKKK
ncbi:MAG: hypothetical protein ACYTFK_00980 [Planctomycetota bacterium]